MKRNDIYKQLMVKEYTNYMTLAVERGVSFDDIIYETRKYHGSRFTDLVLNQFTN